MTDLRTFFRKDTFATYVGVELLDFGPGWSRCRMQVTPDHLNGLGSAHGGAIFSLADFAFAVACNSHGTAAMAIHTNISFVKAGPPGAVLIAEAREESLNPRLGTYSVRVTTEAGDVIALFHGMAYRKNEPLAE